MPAPIDIEASVVIAAGGTGGHIYPGIALAEALRYTYPRAQVSFVGTPRGLESRLIPEAGFELDLVGMVPFTRRYWLRLPFALVRSVLGSIRILRRRKATVVVGMGGYPSLPVIAAARMMRIPALIHESGATLGRANLLSARLTNNVALAFPHMKGRLPSGVMPRVVGMPLRREVADMDMAALRDEARRSHSLHDGDFMIFMFGGSQGAASINRLAIDLSNRWKGRTDVHLVLKTGAGQLEAVKSELDAIGRPNTSVIGFIDRMDLAYAAADLIVSRAGAGTVAEIAVAGLPAILIPYPHAPGDHQTMNATALVQAGAAILIADDQATADNLGPVIEDLIEDRGKLERMRTAAAGVGHPRAAQELARWVMDISK